MWNWDWLVCSERGSLSDLFGFEFGRLGHLESDACSFQKKSLGFWSGLFYRLKTSTNFNTNIFLARCLFFWGRLPSIQRLEAPLEKNQRLAIARHPKLQNSSLRSVLGLIFTSKPISELGKLDKFSHFFFLDFGLDVSHSKKRSY